MASITFTPPKTFKAAAVTGKHVLELIDMPWKDPQPGHIVVKVLACGVCHSDGLVYDQAWPAGLPRVPGHEIVGDVVAVPSSEKTWKVGERVGGGWHGGHCSACDRCREGDFMTCENENINGVVTDGGYAEFVTLRTEAVVRIPKELDPAEVAPLLCAGVTVYNSMRNMDVRPGDVVAVQGIGGLGHLAIQYYRAMGYRTVALSSGPSKEAFAKELGAHVYIDTSKEDPSAALQKLGGAKVIACTTTNPETTGSLMNGLKVGGQLLLLSVIPQLTVPTLPMISKRLSLRSWPSGTHKDSEDTIAFSQLAGVQCKIERYPLDRAVEAFHDMMAGKPRFRAVIVP